MRHLEEFAFLIDHRMKGHESKKQDKYCELAWE